MAQFHADWSSKICDVVLPYLFDSESLRLARLAGIFREWALERTDIKLDIIKSNRTYTRFTTDKMSCILPNTPGSLGGWNTDNRYFYEIINRNGKNAYIQLAISAKNITEELRTTCDKLNQFYPAKMGKVDWQWRIPFKTSTILIDDDIKKETVFASLDSCMNEIITFEADFLQYIWI
jgi:hypothetical protein